MANRGGPTFKTDVNRQKTQRWATAKSYSYDGGDWGDYDEYDDYDDYDEPPPPPKPTGLRQRGQSNAAQSGNASPVIAQQPALPQQPPQQPPQQSYQQTPQQPQRPRADSFEYGDDRPGLPDPPPPAISGRKPSPQGPPPESQTGPSAPSIQPESRPQESSFAPQGHRGPPSGGSARPRGPSGSAQVPNIQTNLPYERQRSPPQNAPPYNQPPSTRPRNASNASQPADPYPTRQFGPSASRGSPVLPVGPEPLSSKAFPPRKESLRSKERPSLSNLRAAEASGRASPKQPSPQDDTQESSSGMAQPAIKFVRPADIYRRVDEERERERQSSESGRPSMESIERAGQQSEIDSTSRLKPTLDPVAERRSEYGMDGFPMFDPNLSAPKPSTSGVAPSLPQFEHESGFGAGLLDPAMDTSNAKDIEKEVASEPQPAVSQQITQEENNPQNLAHQPSQGFRSVVERAFDEGKGSSSQGGSQRSTEGSHSDMSRSNTDSTAGISPIMSRVPSAGTAQKKTQDRQDRMAATPSIAEVAGENEPRPASTETTKGPSQSTFMAETAHVRNTSGESGSASVKTGYRRDLSTPSPNNSLARIPAISTHGDLQKSSVGEMAMTTPVDRSAEDYSPDATESQNDERVQTPDYSRRESDIATEVNTSPDARHPGAGIAEKAAQTSFVQAQQARSKTPSMSESRPDSPSKGRVKVIARKYTDLHEMSRKNSSYSPSGSVSSWSSSVRPTSSPQDPIAPMTQEPGQMSADGSQEQSYTPKPDQDRFTIEDPSLRPRLPGEWVSYANTEASEASNPAAGKTTPGFGSEAGDSNRGDDVDLAPNTAKVPLSGKSMNDDHPLAAVTAAGNALAETLKQTVGMETQGEDSDRSMTPDVPDWTPGAASLKPPPTDRTGSSPGSTVAPTPPAKDTPYREGNPRSSGYFPPVGRLHVTNQESPSVERNDEDSALSASSGLSTDSNVADTESDRLRKDIIRGLNPSNTPKSERPTPPRSTPGTDEGSSLLQDSLSNQPRPNTLMQSPTLGSTEFSKTNLKRFSWEDPDEDAEFARSGEPTKQAPLSASPEDTQRKELSPQLNESDPESPVVSEKTMTQVPPAPMELPGGEVEATSPTISHSSQGRRRSSDKATKPIPATQPSIRLASGAKSGHQMSDPTITPFKDIMAMNHAGERTKRFNNTRDQFVTVNTGLNTWLVQMLDNHPELAEKSSVTVRPTVNTAGLAGSMRKISPSLTKLARSGTMDAGSSSAGPDPAGASGSPSVASPGGSKRKELFQSAGAFSGKATHGAKGLFAKGKSRLRPSTEKDPTTQAQTSLDKRGMFSSFKSRHRSNDNTSKKSSDQSHKRAYSDQRAPEPIEEEGDVGPQVSAKETPENASKEPLSAGLHSAQSPQATHDRKSSESNVPQLEIGLQAHGSGSVPKREPTENTNQDESNQSQVYSASAEEDAQSSRHPQELTDTARSNEVKPQNSSKIGEANANDSSLDHSQDSLTEIKNHRVEKSSEFPEHGLDAKETAHPRNIAIKGQSSENEVPVQEPHTNESAVGTAANITNDDLPKVKSMQSEKRISRKPVKRSFGSTDYQEYQDAFASLPEVVVPPAGLEPAQEGRQDFSKNTEKMEHHASVEEPRVRQGGAGGELPSQAPLETSTTPNCPPMPITPFKSPTAMSSTASFRGIKSPEALVSPPHTQNNAGSYFDVNSTTTRPHSYADGDGINVNNTPETQRSSSIRPKSMMIDPSRASHTASSSDDLRPTTASTANFSGFTQAGPNPAYLSRNHSYNSQINATSPDLYSSFPHPYGQSFHNVPMSEPGRTPPLGTRSMNRQSYTSRNRPPSLVSDGDFFAPGVGERQQFEPRRPGVYTHPSVSSISEDQLPANLQTVSTNAIRRGGSGSGTPPGPSRRGSINAASALGMEHAAAVSAVDANRRGESGPWRGMSSSANPMPPEQSVQQYQTTPGQTQVARDRLSTNNDDAPNAVKSSNKLAKKGTMGATTTASAADVQRSATLQPQAAGKSTPAKKKRSSLLGSLFGRSSTATPLTETPSGSAADVNFGGAKSNKLVKKGSKSNMVGGQGSREHPLEQRPPVGQQQPSAQTPHPTPQPPQAEAPRQGQHPSAQQPPPPPIPQVYQRGGNRFYQPMSAPGPMHLYPTTQNRLPPKPTARLPVVGPAPGTHPQQYRSTPGAPSFTESSYDLASSAVPLNGTAGDRDATKGSSDHDNKTARGEHVTYLRSQGIVPERPSTSAVRTESSYAAAANRRSMGPPSRGHSTDSWVALAEGDTQRRRWSSYMSGESGSELDLQQQQSHDTSYNSKRSSYGSDYDYPPNPYPPVPPLPTQPFQYYHQYQQPRPPPTVRMNRYYARDNPNSNHNSGSTSAATTSAPTRRSTSGSMPAPYQAHPPQHTQLPDRAAASPSPAPHPRAYASPEGQIFAERERAMKRASTAPELPGLPEGVADMSEDEERDAEVTNSMNQERLSSEEKIPVV
ncbi:MAG: hypothetical protein M1831_000679 [Alyxoria varia]|nr:MAG: hypothetical protein M1831_000679 [Alyxoria varia]